MFVSSQDAQNFDEATLIRFLNYKIEEGIYLDYKSQMYSGSSSKDAKIELLKDITGFANAQGGTILVGVAEPSENLAVSEQIIGIENGTDIAQKWERLVSSSIDPRVPGIKIFPIELDNGKSVLLIHIPPSMSKPHMVNQSGHTAFYIRHRESTTRMTTSEVRDSVLYSYNAERDVMQYMLDKEQESLEEFSTDATPYFVLQACPLISPDPLWDIHSGEFTEILKKARGSNAWNLNPDTFPMITIGGLYCDKERNDPGWRITINQNGYLELIYRIKHRPSSEERISDGKPESQYVVHKKIELTFRDFCNILNECWQTTGTDLPYVFKCKLINNNRDDLLFIYGEDNMFTDDIRSSKYKFVWPIKYRLQGHDVDEIAQSWFEELHHGFGVLKPD